MTQAEAGDTQVEASSDGAVGTAELTASNASVLPSNGSAPQPVAEQPSVQAGASQQSQQHTSTVSVTATESGVAMPPEQGVCAHDLDTSATLLEQVCARVRCCRAMPR
jgi:hypothetical protein